MPRQGCDIAKTTSLQPCRCCNAHLDKDFEQAETESRPLAPCPDWDAVALRTARMG